MRAGSGLGFNPDMVSNIGYNKIIYNLELELTLEQ